MQETKTMHTELEERLRFETPLAETSSILERVGWRVAGKGGAAEILGLKRSTLHSKMQKLRIHRPAS